MTVDREQTIIFQQVAVRKLYDLEEEYKNSKGYVRIALAKKIKKLKKKLKDK